MNGKILEIIQTFDGKYRVIFETDCIDELNGLDGMIQISAKKVTHKRSLRMRMLIFMFWLEKLRMHKSRRYQKPGQKTFCLADTAKGN